MCRMTCTFFFMGEKRGEQDWVRAEKAESGKKLRAEHAESGKS